MEKHMEFIKKHVYTVFIIGAIVTSMLWMNSKFNEVDARFAQIEREIDRVKTVLIIQIIMPLIMPSKFVTKE